LTAKVYGALEAFLDGDQPAARHEAVAIHSAVLGLAHIFGLSDSLSDPLKHSVSDLVDALINTLILP